MIGKRSLAAWAPLAAAVPLAIGLLNAPRIRAQSANAAAPTPEFEVASVKPAAPVAGKSRGGNGPWGFATDPGRLHATNITLRELFRQAYHLKEYELTGGPPWIDSNAYDVDAKSATGSGRDELMLMLRKLVAARFQLKFHRESTEMTVVALMVGKSGTENMESVKESDPDPAKYSVNKPGEPFHMHKVTMETLAMMLCAADAMRDTPVLDRTGLKGMFDLTFTPVPDETTDRTGMIGAMPQLGLDLKRQKASVEIYIIDSANKVPIEN
jgi:uncharacterized protein (TIGR03435 family)